jgi:hypothetical protein
MHVRIRMAAVNVDGAQQLLCPARLLNLRLPGSEADLLISQFTEGRNFIVRVHRLPNRSTCCLAVHQVATPSRDAQPSSSFRLLVSLLGGEPSHTRLGLHVAPLPFRRLGHPRRKEEHSVPSWGIRRPKGTLVAISMIQSPFSRLTRAAPWPRSVARSSSTRHGGSPARSRFLMKRSRRGRWPMWKAAPST